MSHKFSNKQAWRNSAFTLAGAVTMVAEAKPLPEQYTYIQDYQADLDVWQRTYNDVAEAQGLVQVVADDIATGMDPTVAMMDAIASVVDDETANQEAEGIIAQDEEIEELAAL